ncbi:MAG: NIFsuperfamily protein [Nitrososphaera sp.]|nr:NIFsuperfamily protein [Nitrososphaera sp.]
MACRSDLNFSLCRLVAVAVDTDRIMKVGLELAGWKKMPADSAVHIKGKNINKVLIGIDIGTAELMLAKQLECDAVIAHHPIGATAVNFYKVFDTHIDYMVEHGVPKKVAREAVEKLKERIETRNHASIYSDVVGAAKVLGIPLVNIHQPCDEYMRQVILRAIKASRTEYVSDIVKSIGKIPEFRHAATKVRVRFGNQNNKAGHWTLVVAAGTNGGFNIAKAYFQHGVSTVIYLHIDYGELMKMREEKLEGNLVVMGHLGGDSIGLNGLAERLENLGIETVRVGILPNR